MEFPERSLKQLTMAKKDSYLKNQNQPDFDEEQQMASETEDLTYLLYHMVEANAFLQEKRTPHRDINPQSIFITPSQEFKLLLFKQ